MSHLIFPTRARCMRCGTVLQVRTDGRGMKPCPICEENARERAPTTATKTSEQKRDQVQKEVEREPKKDRVRRIDLE